MHCIIIHLQRLHMLPVGEQDNIFTYLLIIQVLHHLNGVELGLC